ncbi:hypothetical protein GCK32_020110, partial [Trichostrongylus colubriformis]
FSSNFALYAKKLANEHIRPKSRNLIVIRVYEYHHKVFPEGHTIEGLWEWFKRSRGRPEPYVWEIPYKGPAWEPQFIMSASDPFSEENIPTRFLDQQALVSHCALD